MPERLPIPIQPPVWNNGGGAASFTAAMDGVHDGRSKYPARRLRISMSGAADQGFLADGYHRARAAVEPRIRAQVRSEYRDRLNNASSAERARLEKEMADEIKRRIDAQAPPDALY